MPLLIAAALCALPLRVTIHTRAQPLHLLLPTLSVQTGRRLTVDKPLAGEWLVIEAKDVDPNALLERIAEVTHAEWSQDSSGRYRLSRTPARERTLADEEQSFILQEIRRKFAPSSTPYDLHRAAERLNRAIAQRNRSDEPKDLAEYIAAQLDSPTYHALSELVPLLPLGEISRLQSPEDLVFASHPSGSQRPLPPGAATILDRLSRNWDRYRSHIAENDSSLPLGTFRQATLKVEPRSTIQGSFVFSFSLSLRNDQGKTISGASQSVFCKAAKLSLPFAKEAKPFQSNPLSVKLEEALEESDRFRSPEGPLGRAMPEIRNAILHPERDGRLTRLWSDVMFAYAARESKALVANLPDHMEGFSLRYVYPRRLEDFLNTPHGLELRRDSEWITFRLRYPGPAGMARSDRETIGRGIRWVADGGGLSFEMGSAIQAALGRHVNQFTPGFKAFDGTGVALSGIPHPWSPVGLVRFLPDSLRSALRTGQRLSFRQLPKPAQDLLRSYFLRSSNFILAPEGEGRPQYDMNLDVTRLIGPREVAGLNIDTQEEDHPLFIASYDPASPLRHSLFGVAAFPPGDPALVGTVPGRRYRLGTSRKRTLTIHFPNGYRQSFDDVAHVFEPRSPYLTVEQFPPAIREYLAERRDLLLHRDEVSRLGVTTAFAGTSP